METLDDESSLTTFQVIHPDEDMQVNNMVPITMSQHNDPSSVMMSCYVPVVHRISKSYQDTTSPMMSRQA